MFKIVNTFTGAEYPRRFKEKETALAVLEEHRRAFFEYPANHGCYFRETVTNASAQWVYNHRTQVWEWQDRHDRNLSTPTSKSLCLSHLTLSAQGVRLIAFSEDGQYEVSAWAAPEQIPANHTPVILEDESNLLPRYAALLGLPTGAFSIEREAEEDQEN